MTAIAERRLEHLLRDLPVDRQAAVLAADEGAGALERFAKEPRPRPWQALELLGPDADFAQSAKPRIEQLGQLRCRAGCLGDEPRDLWSGSLAALGRPLRKFPNQTAQGLRRPPLTRQGLDLTLARDQ